MGHLNINTFPIDLGASFWLTVAAVLNFGQGHSLFRLVCRMSPLSLVSSTLTDFSWFYYFIFFPDTFVLLAHPFYMMVYFQMKCHNLGVNNAKITSAIRRTVTTLPGVRNRKRCCFQFQGKKPSANQILIFWQSTKGFYLKQADMINDIASLPSKSFKFIHQGKMFSCSAEEFTSN